MNKIPPRVYKNAFGGLYTLTLAPYSNAELVSLYEQQNPYPKADRTKKRLAEISNTKHTKNL